MTKYTAAAPCPAALGPRLDGRGDEQADVNPDDAHKPQWGRGSMAAEIGMHNLLAFEPTVPQWGRGSMAAEMSGVNDCPRCGRQPQWGRGSMAAEMSK